MKGDTIISKRKARRVAKGKKRKKGIKEKETHTHIYIQREREIERREIYQRVRERYQRGNS